jgi:hypothetical protein
MSTDRRGGPRPFAKNVAYGIPLQDEELAAQRQILKGQPTARRQP